MSELSFLTLLSESSNCLSKCTDLACVDLVFRFESLWLEAWAMPEEMAAEVFCMALLTADYRARHELKGLDYVAVYSFVDDVLTDYETYPKADVTVFYGSTEIRA